MRFLSILFFGSMGFQSLAQVTFVSPNASSLGMYNSIPVGYYTGIPRIEIPIHQIIYKDFQLPVMLKYHAAGIRIQEKPGDVGLGWSIHFGGVINRSIKGQPDESGFFIDYHHLNEPGAPDKFLELAELDNMKSNFGVAIYDLQPDIFNYSFAGCSGKFFMGSDGVMHAAPDNNLKIRVGYLLANGDFQDWSAQGGNVGAIMITGDDGTIYYFGGSNEDSKSGTEVSYGVASTGGNGGFVSSTSWFVKKIVLPNNKGQIDFEYNTVPEKKYIYFRNTSTATALLSVRPDPTDIILRASFFDAYHSGNERILYNRFSGAWFTASSDICPEQSPANYSIQNIDSKVISKISTPDEVITFSYLPANSLLYFDQTQNKLNEIFVYNKKDYPASFLKKFELTYLESPASRLALREVREVSNSIKKNSYLIEYYDDPSINLPDYSSEEVDHWGFYNGPSGDCMVPNPFFLYCNREPVGFFARNDGRYLISEEKAKAIIHEGMIKKITYPTNGFTTFEFEQHDYSSIQANGLEYPAALPNMDAGGVRIKFIADYDNITGTRILREFKYLKDYTTNTTEVSSGILNGIFSYNYQYDIQKDPKKKIHLLSSSSSGGFQEDGHIGYTEVVEVTNNNGFSVYKFNHTADRLFTQKAIYNEYSDLEAICGSEFIERGQSDNLAYSQISSYISPNTTSFSHERGLLKSMVTYSGTKSAHRKLKEKTYGYTPVLGGYNLFVPAVVCHTVPSECERYHLGLYYNYYYPFLLTSESEAAYDMADESKVVTSTRTIQYNDHSLPFLQTASLSDGKTKSALTLYPLDYTNTTGFLADMKLANMVNMPVEIVTYVTVGSNVKIVDANLTTYKSGGEAGLKNIVYNAELMEPLSMSLFKFSNRTVAGEVPPVGQNANLNIDTEWYKPVLTYDTYDANGNLLQYHKENESPVSYVWDVNSKPIAEFIRASADQVYYTSFEDNGVLGTPAKTGKRVHMGSYTIPFTPPNDGEQYFAFYAYNLNGSWLFKTIPFSSVIDEQQIDELRVYPKGVDVTTYTYDQVKYISTITDTNGQTKYFYYDELMRLKVIKDHNGNIIKTYDYNYQHR